MFVCIRKKVPLLLRLVMDFVGTGAEAAKLKEVVSAIQSGDRSPTHMLWEVVSRGMRRRLFAERTVSEWEVTGK
jgi:hypothetical protein